MSITMLNTISVEQRNTVRAALIVYADGIKSMDVEYPSSVLDEIQYNPDFIEGDEDATNEFYNILNDAVEAADELFDAGCSVTAAECFAAAILSQVEHI